MLDFPEREKTVRVLIVGGGGREHALAWKLAQSEKVESILCAPGNGGTQVESKTRNVALQSSPADFPAIAELCRDEKIDLVVVGPDNPLADGIVDFLEEHGIRAFGPTREQAKLEWSKAHAKQFMNKIGLPTARYAVCTTFAEALNTVSQNDWARVIKVDGLAFGKGVFVCDSEEEARAALGSIFENQTFGEAGQKVVIEERLVGEELSLLMLVDGKTVKVMEPSQDHKRRYDGDKGPNTGGMGAYSPVDAFAHLNSEIDRLIVEPIRRALSEGELDFKGVLYAGLLIGRPAGAPEAAKTPGGSQSRSACGSDAVSQSTGERSAADRATATASNEEGSGAREGGACTSPAISRQTVTPYVLEFNARFGDPETQALLPRLRSDLLPLLWACTTGALEQAEMTWSQEKSCCVVAVADSYPSASQNAKGQAIKLSPLPERCVLFQAGTKMQDGQLVTNGGRVLAVVGLAPDMEAAAARSYEGLKSVSFNGIEYRHDIARRAMSKCLSS